MTEPEAPLDPEAQQRYLEAMRRQEAEYVAQARRAFAVAADVPLLGSFQEDDPEFHQSMANPQAPEAD